MNAMEAPNRSVAKTVKCQDLLAARIGLSMKAVEEFCDRWQVGEFAFFGSVLRADFGPESDVDVLVRFKPEARLGLFEFADMELELRHMFGRKVDLVTRAAVEGSRNYIRRNAVLESAQVVYAA